MTKNSAPSGAMAPACPSVAFDRSTLDEMLDGLSAVEDYLMAAEDNAVHAFDGAAERGTPADRVTIDHLADTTSALHRVRDVITSIDVEIGMSTLPGPGREFTIDTYQLCSRTGYDMETVAELYENLGDGEEAPRADEGIDLVYFVHDLIRDREKLVDRIENMRSPETMEGIQQEIDRLRLKRERNAHDAAAQAGLKNENDLPTAEEAAAIFAAAGHGDWSRVSDRMLKAVNLGAVHTLSSEDEALIRDIQEKTAETVANAQRCEHNQGRNGCDLDTDCHREEAEEYLPGQSPEDIALARFVAIDNARRPVVLIRTSAGDEIEVR